MQELENESGQQLRFRTGLVAGTVSSVLGSQSALATFDPFLSTVQNSQHPLSLARWILVASTSVLERHYRSGHPSECSTGWRAVTPHPNGIVIHPGAILGPNCLVFQQVTIGNGGRKHGVPILGGHVDVGAGARLLGGIIIGDHAKIGANAVVLDDVPAGATAVGVPARIIRASTD